MCILRDLPQQKNLRPMCWGRSPNFTCSHIPIEIFNFLQTGKQAMKSKESCLHQGRFQYSWCLGTPLGLTPWGAHAPSLKRTHKHMNLPYNKTSLNPCLMLRCVCIWQYILQNYTYKLHFQNLSIYHIPHVFIRTLAAENLDVCISSVCEIATYSWPW
jgi:hypothetical protein